jgi:hypothetical protein
MKNCRTSVYAWKRWKGEKSGMAKKINYEVIRICPDFTSSGIWAGELNKPGLWAWSIKRI